MERFRERMGGLEVFECGLVEETSEVMEVEGNLCGRF